MKDDIKQVSIGEEKAIKLYEEKWWEGKTDQEIVTFQLFTVELAMPFDLFHRSVEECLGRPVFTHQFAFAQGIMKEFLGEKEAPTFEEIVNLLPSDKKIIIAG